MIRGEAADYIITGDQSSRDRKEHKTNKEQKECSKQPGTESPVLQYGCSSCCSSTARAKNRMRDGVHVYYHDTRVGFPTREREICRPGGVSHMPVLKESD